MKKENGNNDTLLVNTEELMLITSTGRTSAQRIGIEAQARVKIGGRVLWNVEKIRSYLNSNSTSDIMKDNLDGYGLVCNQVLHTHGILSSEAKLVYCILCSYANGELTCCPTVATIASDAEMSIKIIYRALSELDSHGIIERKRQKRTTGNNIYIIHHNALSERL